MLRMLHYCVTRTKLYWKKVGKNMNLPLHTGALTEPPT